MNAIPGTYYSVEEPHQHIEDVLTKAMPCINGQRILILLCLRTLSPQGDRYVRLDQVKIKLKKFNSPQEIVDAIGQIEADAKMASTRAKWRVLIVPKCTQTQ